MRLRAICLIGAMGGALAFGQARPLSVRVTAPHARLLARISGPRVTVVDGHQIRGGASFVIVSTPADLVIDPRVGDFYFQLEPDTAWVTVDVQAEAAGMSASSYNVVVGYDGIGLVVAGVPRRRPGTP